MHQPRERKLYCIEWDWVNPISGIVHGQGGELVTALTHPYCTLSDGALGRAPLTTGMPLLTLPLASVT